MAFELIAAIVSAVACGGIALMLRKLSRGFLPKWIVPVMAGIGLISFTIWSEYSWFERVSTGLPDGFRVVREADDFSPFRPWTMIAPLTTRFTAVDMYERVNHPQNAALRIAPIYHFARWKLPIEALMVFDCEMSRQVLLSEGVRVSDEGVLEEGEWREVALYDGAQEAACEGGLKPAYSSGVAG
jgi:hypothetical protein